MRYAYALVSVVLFTACNPVPPGGRGLPTLPSSLDIYNWLHNRQATPPDTLGLNCRFKFNKVVDTTTLHFDTSCWESGTMLDVWLPEGGAVALYKEQLYHVHVVDKPDLDPAINQTPCADHALGSPCDMEGIRVCRDDAVGLDMAHAKETPCGKTGMAGCANCEIWFSVEHN